jgi:hypothetical protein
VYCTDPAAPVPHIQELPAAPPRPARRILVITGGVPQCKSLSLRVRDDADMAYRSGLLPYLLYVDGKAPDDIELYANEVTVAGTPREPRRAPLAVASRATAHDQASY